MMAEAMGTGGHTFAEMVAMQEVKYEGDPVAQETRRLELQIQMEKMLITETATTPPKWNTKASQKLNARSRLYVSISKPLTEVCIQYLFQ